MISIYSVISSIIFYNLGLFILFVLRRKTDFMARYAISTLLLLSVLSMVRLVLPIDFDAAHVIRSETILPKLIDIMDISPNFWPLSIGNTLKAIWFLGSVVRAAKIFLVEYRAYKSHRIYPRIASEQLKTVSQKLGKAYKIVISPKVSQPYTMGILKPIIYLPYIEYSDEELYYILLHEVQHIKSQDNLKRLIFLIVEAVFWWNPLARIAVEEFEVLTECICDSKVTATMDKITVVDYLATIVSVSKRLAPDEDKAKPKLAVMFAQTDDVIQRFEVLLRRNDCRPKRIRYAVWLLMLVLFVMSYFVIIQPYYGAPAVFTGTDLEINQDNSYILAHNGTYYYVYDNVIFDELTTENLSLPPYNSLIIIGE